MISIIIPTLNDQHFITECLKSIRSCSREAESETIIADGGSTDATLARLPRRIRVIRTAPVRAQQLNGAAALASGDILFFLRPNNLLPPGSLEAIEKAVYRETYDGGGFSISSILHDEKTEAPLQKPGKGNSDSSNTHLSGENGIFVHAGVFTTLCGFRPIPVMEDYDFCRRMKKHHRVVRITQPRLLVRPIPSPQNGIFRKQLKRLAMRSLFRLGVPPEVMVKFFRKEK